MNESRYSPPASVASAQRTALIVGVVGLVVCGLGYAADHHQFLRSYLMAFVFWAGVGLGSMALAMIAHLSGGAWGVVARRVFEASSRTLPLLAVLFLPIALGLKDLYLWASPEAVAADPILQHKEPYLNSGFFLARTLLYFVIWTGIAWALSTWSRQQDEGADTALRMQRLSGAGLLVYAITVFFMSVDWIMSLDPHWFSTIYGMLFMVGQGLSALAFTIVVLVLLARSEPYAHVIGPNHLQDLGKLTFAFVMLWAYLTFSQFLIVWSANLPEEIPWYLTRMQHGWGWIGLLLIFGHFFLPFFILLNRDIKRNAPQLLTVAVFILVIRFADIFWLIGPPHGEEGVAVHWLDAVTPLGIGGIVVAWFLWQLSQVPLIPLREPFLQEAIEHGRKHH
jgi:hypothetical protein